VLQRQKLRVGARLCAPDALRLPPRSLSGVEVPSNVVPGQEGSPMSRVAIYGREAPGQAGPVGPGRIGRSLGSPRELSTKAWCGRVPR
jgi:hypothetical protein